MQGLKGEINKNLGFSHPVLAYLEIRVPENDLEYPYQNNRASGAVTVCNRYTVGFPFCRKMVLWCGCCFCSYSL